MTERRELKERRWVIEGLWVGFALPRDLDPARYKELIWASRHHRSSGAARGVQVARKREPYQRTCDHGASLSVHGVLGGPGVLGVSLGSANPTSEPVITAPPLSVHGVLGDPGVLGVSPFTLASTFSLSPFSEINPVASDWLYA
jgi:hypothetical protein